jgi:mannosylglucosylglycerate synthase
MRLGMLGARFVGLDGVTLESEKIADALERDGHTFAWFAGHLGPRFSPGLIEPVAALDNDENRYIDSLAFDGGSTDLESRIAAAAETILASLVRFVNEQRIQAVVVQNALAIPLHLPLGLALTRLIQDTGIASIAHHHDFGWERARFADCAVPDLLERCFPPAAPNLAHVVIHSGARADLKRRTGIDATVLPNIMDFEHGPSTPSDGNRFRRAVGLADNDVILLQPTRIIERKGIERTIELAARIDMPNVKVVATHSDDLDHGYWARLGSMAGELGVDLRLAACGGLGPSLGDAYAAADLVCFPSTFEGFGNALLEAFFYRRPVLVNRYSVYRSDIEPTGVECIEIDGVVTDVAVARVRRWIEDPASSETAIERNYQIGIERFSYRVARLVYKDVLETVLT